MGSGRSRSPPASVLAAIDRGDLDPDLTATLTEGTNGGTLAWKLTIRNLTGKAVAAHIHVGVRGKSGNVLVPLCAAPAKPCRSGMTGRVHVNHTTFDVLEKRATYVNVHTVKNPAGEIRAQLKISQP